MNLPHPGPDTALALELDVGAAGVALVGGGVLLFLPLLLTVLIISGLLLAVAIWQLVEDTRDADT